MPEKVVIVTGASGGIGEATARRFALEGWRVVLAARSADKLEKVAEQLRTRGATLLVVPTDVTDPAQVQALVAATIEKWGRVDALINNAGRGLLGTVATVDRTQLRELFALNLFAPVDAIQAVVPHMRQQGSGAIVNVSSMIEKLPVPFMGSYAASKIALSYLTDAARIELNRDGIRVVNVLPGQTDTHFAPNTMGSDQINDPSWDVAGFYTGWSNQLSTGGVPPSEVAETIWQAVTMEQPPRQMVVGESNAQGAALAPLLTPLLLPLMQWLLNRYMARPNGQAPSSPAKDLALIGGGAGALLLLVAIIGVGGKKALHAIAED